MIGRVGYLLGNILSSVIGRIWVDWPSMGLPIFPNSCFGPNEPGLCSGCYRGIRAWHGPHCSFGLASGMLCPVLYPHQYIYIYIYIYLKGKNMRLFFFFLTSLETFILYVFK